MIDHAFTFGEKFVYLVELFGDCRIEPYHLHRTDLEAGLQDIIDNLPHLLFLDYMRFDDT